MPRRFYTIIFLLLILIGLSGFAFARLGYFPVAVVNYKFISENQYSKLLEASLLNLSGDQVSSNEIKRMALQQMIEDELIYREAESRLGKEIRNINEVKKIKALLSDSLEAANIIFDDWLHLAKNNARVIILVPGFSWENGKIVAYCDSVDGC